MRCSIFISPVCSWENRGLEKKFGCLADTMRRKQKCPRGWPGIRTQLFSSDMYRCLQRLAVKMREGQKLPVPKLTHSFIQSPGARDLLLLTIWLSRLLASRHGMCRGQDRSLWLPAMICGESRFVSLFPLRRLATRDREGQRASQNDAWKHTFWKRTFEFKYYSLVL